MADENGDFKQASLEDSNMANYGGKEMRDLRKSAAASDKNFEGAGQKVGLEVWRVENRRTKADTPDFGVKRWPKEDYGSFYTGDSYLILNTYLVKDPLTGKPTDKLGWDVHFWLGNESSQDEIGVAAYKAVELDDLLDDGPVQHRETQGNESALFQSYFKGIQYMEGGIASGFRHVKPDEYTPRLFQVRRTRKTVRAWEVPVKATSLNHGDVFILDAGLKVYTFIGEFANAFEKMKGGAIAHNLVAARQGKSKSVATLDEDAWKILGGGPSDIQPADETDDEPQEEALKAENCKLFRLSDSTGKMVFSKEAEGKLSQSQLDTNDVFVIDAGLEIFVWVGNGTSPSEKQQCMKYAMDYLKHENRPATTPVTRIKEGQVHHVFGMLVAPVGGSLPVRKSVSPASRPPAAAASTAPKVALKPASAPAAPKPASPAATPAPAVVLKPTSASPSTTSLDADLAIKEASKFNPDDENKVAEWIAAVTGVSKGSTDFLAWLKDGQVLVKLGNELTGGKANIKANVSAMPFKQMENIANFLAACRKHIGMRENELFTTADLYDGKSRVNVINGLVACSRAASKSGYSGPAISGVGGAAARPASQKLW